MSFIIRFGWFADLELILIQNLLLHIQILICIVTELNPFQYSSILSVIHVNGALFLDNFILFNGTSSELWFFSLGKGLSTILLFLIYIHLIRYSSYYLQFLLTPCSLYNPLIKYQFWIFGLFLFQTLSIGLNQHIF